MATKKASAKRGCKQIRREEDVQFLNVFSSEFNNESLHDRVLVFEVIEELEEKAEACKASGDLQSSEDESENESSDDGSTNGEEEEKASQAETSKNNQNTSDAWKVKIGKVVKDDKSMIETEGEERERGKNERKESHEEIECCPETKETKTTKLFVHSSWLAVHSSYFKALFFSGMKESHLKEVVMKVKQSELQAHLTLIEAIYKMDVLDDKDCCHVVDVLALADKYDVNIVFKKCKRVLISSSITLEKCESITKIVSGISDCTDVLDAMEAFLVKEFSPLDKTWLLGKFSTLSKEVLKLLLGSDKLVVESENTVFVALMEWIRFHRKEDILDGRSLLSLVRFKLMTVNFMYDVVMHEPLAKQLDGFNEFFQHGLAYHAFSPTRLRELKIKPVSRCTYHNLGPTFSWVIGQKEQSTLIDDGAIHSNYFWSKGYRIKFKLGFEGEPNNRYSFFLFVQNIQKESHVEISWTAKSDLFARHVQSHRHIYASFSTGRGKKTVESRVTPSKDSNASPQTIDAWVNLF